MRLQLVQDTSSVALQQLARVRAVATGASFDQFSVDWRGTFESGVCSPLLNTFLPVGSYFHGQPAGQAGEPFSSALLGIHSSQEATGTATRIDSSITSQAPKADRRAGKSVAAQLKISTINARSLLCDTNPGLAETARSVVFRREM
eukprot:931137-Amphidinium_carterae.1